MSCSGTPLETSKRKMMYPVLYSELFNWMLQVGVVSEYPVLTVLVCRLLWPAHKPTHAPDQLQLHL